MIVIQPFVPLRLVARLQFRLRQFGEPEKVLGVGESERRPLIGLFEPSRRVLPNRFQHPETGVPLSKQALVDERCE